ncbi:MAG: hypothetical protein ACPG88_05730, partial [Porticoccaceae bacterium]
MASLNCACKVFNLPLVALKLARAEASDLRDTALAFAATLTLAAAIFLREASTRAAWAAILEFRAITLATALDTALGAADFLAAAFLAGAFLAATFFAGALLAG